MNYRLYYVPAGFDPGAAPAGVEFKTVRSPVANGGTSDNRAEWVETTFKKKWVKDRNDQDALMYAQVGQRVLSKSEADLYDQRTPDSFMTDERMESSFGTGAFD